MLSTSTLTLAIMYIMLLCDNIIAGKYLGTVGVAAINTVTPITAFVGFASNIISIGSSIIYSRMIGEMKKRRADEIFGQGLLISIGLSVGTVLFLVLGRDLYFSVNHIDRAIYSLASEYYRWTPLNAVLAIMNSYLAKLVFTDGDETNTNISYIVQIIGNILFSILLARQYGMVGIILGTIIGNILGTIVLFRHFFQKSNTLHFVWHFSLSDMVLAMRYSIVDAVLYFCFAAMDYILIDFISEYLGRTGEITLAVVVSLLEYDIVLDGIGMAAQPLIETYLGEKNHEMVRRLMRIATKAAIVEGLVSNALIFIFARQFCFLFGIKGGVELYSTIHAIRIVSGGLVFCSLLCLMSAYYLVVEHIALAVWIIVFKDGLLYAFLPIVGALLFGENGIWAAFAVAPLIALVIIILQIRLHYGKEMFPYLLKSNGVEVVIFEDKLEPETCSGFSELIDMELVKRNYSKEISNRVALFAEEILLTALEKNKHQRKKLLVELSLLFEKDAIHMIERDNGEIFDNTNQNMKIEGVSSYVLNRMMTIHQEKVYLTTTGYNRSMLQFSAENKGL